MMRPRHVALGLTALLLLHSVDDEIEQIAGLMQIRSGVRIADVGAGDGHLGEELALRVGGEGHVYLQEIDDGELIKIRKRVKKHSAPPNISVVMGESDDTKLPDGCCDAILLRFVYHHMSRPDEMLSSVQRSLRPAGRVVVIEKGDNGGHGIRSEELIEQWSAAGFSVVSHHPDWGGHDDQYAVVFGRARMN